MSEDGAGSGRIQDFIFARELAEVYLLLDHMSGRSDKSLSQSLKNDQTQQDLITDVCKIGWPATGSVVEQANQAATLIKARDLLNILARPANGASIAFTLLVTGDDTDPSSGRFRRTMGRIFVRSRVAETAPPEPPLPSPQVPWEGAAPSRRSLVRIAYPGLIRAARRFRWMIVGVTIFLFMWLIFTCLLSWNIAAGNAILSRLEALDTEWKSISDSIANAERLDTAIRRPKE